jgi:hypothetical protein
MGYPFRELLTPTVKRIGGGGTNGWIFLYPTGNYGPIVPAEYENRIRNNPDRLFKIRYR